MKNPIDLLDEYGFFPIVEIKDIGVVRPLVRTLLDSGLKVMEIPMRTGASLDAMKIVRDEFPEVTLGAGTILTPLSAKQAYDAGARFMLAPGFNPKVVDYCIENGYAIIPGVNSPSQVEWAVEKGLDTVKFFPAEESGGLRYLRAIAHPFKTMRFVPTGGINDSNIGQYLGSGRVIACGGTWIVKEKLIAEGKFDEIGRLIRSAFEAVHGFELESIEIAGSESQSEDAKAFASLFSIEKKMSPVNFVQSAPHVFNHTVSEKERGLFTIVLSTVNLKRAIAYLKRKGSHPLPYTISEKSKNEECEAAYLEKKDACYRFKLIEKSITV